MAWVGIVYELLNADGSRMVTGNCDAAKADPDYIGTLDPESGIVGLLDRAAVRTSSSDLVETDGQSFGPSWLGGRSGTMQGTLRNDSLDPVIVAAAESKLKRATRALRADALLRWTPPNDSAPRQLRVRVQDGPRITGRRPKVWQVTLVSADPYALSSGEQSVVITPGAPAGEIGVVSPVTDPVTSALNVTGQQFVVNQGDAPAWPRLRFDGPVTNPQALNQTSGQRVALAATLGAGEYVEIVPQTGRILLNGTTDRYSYLDFAGTSWWQLGPGSNDVRLLASAFSSPAALTVRWQHGFE